MPITAKRKDEITPPEERPLVVEVDDKIAEVKAALEDLTDRVSEAEKRAETLRNEADDLAARRIAGNDVDGVEEAQSRAAQAEQERDDLKDAVEAHRRALERLKGKRADALREARQAHADEVKKRAGRLLEQAVQAGRAYVRALDTLDAFRKEHRRTTRTALDQCVPFGHLLGPRRKETTTLDDAEERAARLQDYPRSFGPNYLENGST